MQITFEPEKVYHVYTHANGQENLFLEGENYNYFLKKYLEYLHPVVETYAYCLMPNHLHLMVRVRREEEVLEFLRAKKPTLQGFETLGGFSSAISRQFSHLFNGYAQSFNKKYNRKGSLFTPNLKRKLISHEAYFTRLIAYIHNNPIHHGFVKELNAWRHSSWHAYLSQKPTRLAKQEALDWFGDKEEFKRIHQLLAVQDVMLDFE
jgi:putative transposase